VAFLADIQELKSGLIIFRRTDVQHRNWYCRIKLPKEDKYKTVSLKTADINDAKEKAFEQDAELRFKLKHELPVFTRTFAQVAQEFSDFQKARAEIGKISLHRWRVMASHIKTQLNPFIGPTQITLIGQDKWDDYPLWRHKTGKGRSGGRVSDGTVRDEMATFRSIMGYAANRQYIRANQKFTGRLLNTKERRDEFDPAEYTKLHTFARKWLKEGSRAEHVWARTVAYNFVLIMCNTGMRPSEAKNLRWRDVSQRTDDQGRPFVRLSVSGKGKSRQLVATEKVSEYIGRIHEISKATGDNDFVFTTITGAAAKTLYYSLIEDLLIKSGLQLSANGKRRSTYCFRHTYATFRLTEGVDIYLLSKQMGTSVKMIEDHYGHVTADKNAGRILMGTHGWDPVVAPPQERDASEPKATKKRRKGPASDDAASH
jgi:integrase